MQPSKWEDHDIFEFAHVSVDIFLHTISSTGEAATSGRYSLDPWRDNMTLAKTCLTYLCFAEFRVCGRSTEDNIRHRKETHSSKLRDYAVAFWPWHARISAFKKEEWLDVAQILFDPSKPNIFLSWAQEFVLHAVDWTSGKGWFDDISSYSASATPLHYAAMLGLPDLCKRLLSSGCSVNDSSVFGRPLHCAIFGDRAPWAALEHPFKTDTETSRLSASTINVIELLLDAGADINDPYHHLSDKNRIESPLYLTLISNVEVAKFLLTRGALCDTQCLDFIDDNLGIDPGMAELAKTLLPEHVRPEALKRFQEIAKGRV